MGGENGDGVTNEDAIDGWKLRDAVLRQNKTYAAAEMCTTLDTLYKLKAADNIHLR